MKVITIWRGGDFLGVAKDYKSAVKFLIGNRHIKASDEVYVDVDGDFHRYCRIDEYLGEDWADTMTEEWNIREFNNFYDDLYFALEEEEVYSYE